MRRVINLLKVRGSMVDGSCWRGLLKGRGWMEVIGIVSMRFCFVGCWEYNFLSLMCVFEIFLK